MESCSISSEVDLAHVELELAGGLIGALAEDARGVGVLPDFLGNKIDGFGLDADGVQRNTQAGDGVDAFLRDHRMGGSALDFDPILVPLVFEAQLVELVRQIILPLAVIENRIGHRVEGRTAAKPDPALVAAFQLQLEQSLFSIGHREPGIGRKAQCRAFLPFPYSD